MDTLKIRQQLTAALAPWAKFRSGNASLWDEVRPGVRSSHRQHGGNFSICGVDLGAAATVLHESDTCILVEVASHMRWGGNGMPRVYTPGYFYVLVKLPREPVPHRFFGFGEYTFGRSVKAKHAFIRAMRQL